MILLSACNNRWKALEEGFQTPPDSIRTAVYWYWLDNHISKEGVVKDLEAMKRVGITRAFIGNQSEGDADGPVPLFRSGCSTARAGASPEVRGSPRNRA